MLLPPKIITVSEIINNAAVSSIMPISTDKTPSMLLSKADNLPALKVSQKKESIKRLKRHNKSSHIMGKNVIAQINTPQIPTLDRNSDREAVTVESASESTPPATGTVEPTINFAVRRVKLSAEELTTV